MVTGGGREARFNDLEQRICEAETVVTEHSMREAMNEEVCPTLDVNACHVWINFAKDISW